MRIKSPQEKRLDQLKIIYLLYGFVDGVNLSYSVLKYFFDVIATETKKNSNNMMHNWLSSSEGIAGFVLTGVVVIFSMFGNTFKDSDKNIFKRYTAQIWPYVRDFIKSAKNAYKGVRSILYTMNQLGFFNYTNLFLLGAAGVIGSISIATRLGLRAFRNDRKSKQSKNQVLTEELSLGCAYEWRVYPDGLPNEKKDWPLNCYVLECNPIARTQTLSYIKLIDNIPVKEEVDTHAVNVNLLLIATEEQDKQKRQEKIHALLEKDPKKNERFIWSNQRLKAYRDKVKNQTMRQRAYGYVASGIAGFIDGMYLYMGLYAVTVVVPPAFIVITVFSSLYLLVSIVTRLYEEHEFQVRLNLSAVRVNLVSYYRERETISKSLLSYCKSLPYMIFYRIDSEPFSANMDLFKKALQDLELYSKAQDNFTETCKKEVGLRRLGTVSAVLFGLKNGITVYGVVAACLFAIATFLTLAAVPFPPALLIGGVCFGLVCLVGFVAYAVHENKKKRAIVDASEKQYRIVTPEEECIKGLSELYRSLLLANGDYDNSAVNNKLLLQEMQDIKQNLMVSRLLKQQDTTAEPALDATKDRARILKNDAEILANTSVAMNNDLDPSTGLRLTGEKESKLRDASEVLRSVFSGCTKGLKWVVLLCNSLLNLDEAGNNHDSTATFILGGVATAINVVVLGARAWAKGFGLDWVKKAPKPVDSGASASPAGSQFGRVIPPAGKNATALSLSKLLASQSARNSQPKIAPIAENSRDSTTMVKAPPSLDTHRYKWFIHPSLVKRHSSSLSHHGVKPGSTSLFADKDEMDSGVDILLTSQ